MILIHTSVKLVTQALPLIPLPLSAILIHTSVKLVTTQKGDDGMSTRILIHTSVKLVTLTLGYLRLNH